MYRFNPAVHLLAAFCLLVGMVGSAVAADKADPSGTWKWTFAAPDGQETPLTMELKLEGQGLSGKVIHSERTLEISNGTFVDDQVSFEVVAEQDGEKVMAKFKGKLEGDAINGTINVQHGDQSFDFPWNATREKK